MELRRSARDSDGTDCPPEMRSLGFEMHLVGPGLRYQKNLALRHAYFDDFTLDFFYQPKRGGVIVE
jgi:hypothetical protein